MSGASKEQWQAKAYLDMARSLVKNWQDYEAAIPLAEKAVALYPERAVAVFFLGRLNTELKCWESAVSCYEEAVRLEPENVQYRKWLGCTFFQLKNYEKAEPHLEKVVALEPENALYVLYHGSILRRLGRYEESAQLLDRALRIKSKNRLDSKEIPYTYISKSRTQVRLRNMGEAIRLIDKAMVFAEVAGNADIVKKVHQQRIDIMDDVSEAVVTGQYRPETPTEP